MTKTTEAQKRALLWIVYPKLVHTTSKGTAGRKFSIRAKLPRDQAFNKLRDLGLAEIIWERKMYGNELRDVSRFVATAEGKKVAREVVRQELAAKGFFLKGQKVQVLLTLGRDLVGWSPSYLFDGYSVNDTVFVKHTTGVFGGCRTRHRLDQVRDGNR